MPYCPKCKEEFREEIAVCGECAVALVASLDSEENDMEDLEVVCSLSQEDSAYIIHGYLESEGIPCILENASFHASPAPDTELTKIRLWSKKADAAKAREMIDAHEQFDICSSCGHIAGTDDAVCDFCGESFER